MAEGKETVKLKGSLVLLKGYIPEVGEIAPDFTYVQADMNEKSLYDLEGLNKIIPGEKSTISIAESEKAFYVAMNDDLNTTINETSNEDNKANQLIGFINKDKSEIKKAIEKGCKPVSFGNTRLRTETAALYACASVAAQNESE